MTDPIEKLRRLAEAAGLHPSPVTCRCRRCREEGTVAARDALRALPALLDLVEEADNLANVTDAHTRRHYDAVRAALAQALEVTDG